MDRKFQADDQWYASPLLVLQDVKDELLVSREFSEYTIIRQIDGLEEQEKEMWIESVSLSDNISIDEATEAVEEVSNLDMFSNSGWDFSTRTLHDMNGDPSFLRKSNHLTHAGILKRDNFIGVSRQRKSTYITTLKYDKCILGGGENTNLYRPQCSFQSKCDDDIVMVVDVLVPYNRSLHSSELRSSRLLKPFAKFLVRGETLLSDLRQKLTCLSDTVVPLENGWELEPVNFENSTAELFPSSFIFIHDTFYVDSRHENAKDISHPIRTFMMQREIFDPVEAMKMEGVKMIDLKLRLGLPYVFQHSGNCEHLLVFHDLRLLHESDPRSLERYPLAMYEKGNERKCEVCRKAHVEFVVEKHELLPNTFTYFCRQCFQEFNFVHGVKTHSFIAWPYTELKKLEQVAWPIDDFDEET